MCWFDLLLLFLLSERNLAFISTFQVFCHWELQLFPFSLSMAKLGKKKKKLQCGFLPSSSEGSTLPRLSGKTLAGWLLLVSFLLTRRPVFREWC